MMLEVKNKGIGGHQSANMRTDEWLTPQEILLPLGTFDLDPCAPIKRPWPTAKNHFTIEDNGLFKDWFGRVWLNPPYGQIMEAWLKKMAVHKEGIALIFARTDTNAFHKYIFPVADSLLFIKQRITFCNVNGFKAAHNGGAPSVLISYGKENSGTLECSGIKGKHIFLNQPTLIVIGISPNWISVVSIAVKNFGDNELKPIYEMVERIAPDKVAKNKFWKEKVRQKLQILRKKNFPF